MNEAATLAKEFMQVNKANVGVMKERSHKYHPSGNYVLCNFNDGSNLRLVKKGGGFVSYFEVHVDGAKVGNLDQLTN